MSRRDPFSMLRGAVTPSDQERVTPRIETPQGTDRQPSMTPLDFIPSAVPKKRANRKWDKARQGEIATYRGIPAETHQLLIHLAGSLNVPVDEVARAFLEFGIASYHSGKLALNPHPKAQRMTLFPDGNPQMFGTKPGWLHEAFPALKRSPRRKKKGEDPKPWEARVTYRLPPSLKSEIKQIADEHTVGVGELVFYFFKFGLEAFEAGQLRLEPHLKTVGNTLF